MSEPMKEMEAQTYGGTLKHSGDPILTWMMGNVVRKHGRGTGRNFVVATNNAAKLERLYEKYGLHSGSAQSEDANSDRDLGTSGSSIGVMEGNTKPND